MDMETNKVQKSTESDETAKLSKTTSPVTKLKPMEIKVKSSDGKPKNIQITTLSTLQSKSDTANNLGSSEVPAIQVKSADGKPRNVQITTLATFTSPKSKGSNSDECKNSDCDKPTKVLKMKTDNKEQTTDCVMIDDDSNEKCPKIATTPKSESAAKNRTGDEKSTPKRVQLTTLQLFNTNSQSPTTGSSSGEKS